MVPRLKAVWKDKNWDKNGAHPDINKPYMYFTILRWLGR